MRKAMLGNYSLYLFIICVVTALAACSGKNSQTAEESGRQPQPTDTLYTKQKAMAVYAYDPVRALQITDSAVVVGNLSQVRADIIRTRIYSWSCMGPTVDSLLHGPEGARFEVARAIGERLLVHDSLKTDIGLRQDVLEVLVYVARQQQDTARWLRRSQELVEVCHRQGESAESEALRTEAEVGAVLCAMGQRERGMARLDSVLAILDSHEHRQFNWLDATVIALKRKIGVLITEGKYVETLPLARRIIERLNDYEHHPQDYHDGTYREPQDATERADYINFYRTRAQGFMTAAYAALGKQGSMEDVYEQIERSVRDTEAREHLARYHALEQKMAAERQRLEMEAQAQRNLYFAIIVCILLVVAFAALAWYFRQMRIVKRKNRYLAEYIEKSLPQKTLPRQTLPRQTLPRPLPVREGSIYSQEQKQANELTTPLPHREGPGESLPGVGLPGESLLGDASLFSQIHDTIIHEGLYLNPNCDRQMLTDRFGLTKERLGSLFVQYSDAKNVAAFINGLRLAHAAHLLTTQPELDIREVASSSGFGSHQYFSTCFKQRFGLSPTDYRAAKGL